MQGDWEKVGGKEGGGGEFAPNAPGWIQMQRRQASNKVSAPISGQSLIPDT